jgi:thiol-disulfide isomerase/thioredoxin
MQRRWALRCRELQSRAAAGRIRRGQLRCRDRSRRIRPRQHLGAVVRSVRMVEPVLSQLARERAGAPKVVEVNVDENPALAARFQALSIPLLVIMRDGREVDRVIGAVRETQIDQRLAAR